MASPMTREGLKICLLTSTFPIAPEDRVAAPFLPPFIEALQARGAQVMVYTQERPGTKRPVVHAPVSWFPWRSSATALAQLKPYKPMHLWRIGSLVHHGSRQIIPLLRKADVDLCLAAWAVPSGYFAYRAKHALGIPYCVWTLGSDMYSWARYPGVRSLIKRILQDADGVFADGFELGRRVQQLAGRPCEFLPSIRPLPDDDPVARVEVDPTTTNFLFIGRWEKVKGVDVLIEAMKLLKDEGIAVHLYMLGKGSLKGFLAHKIQVYALRDRVFLKEDVPTATLRGYLQRCDCLVIPSRRDSIPLVFSEGLYVQRPLIVAETGDLATLVRRFGLGLVVPPGNPVRLKQALEVFAQAHHQHTPDMRRIEEAKALFDLNRAASDFLSHVAQIIKRPLSPCVPSPERMVQETEEDTV